jgi:carboxypeptidase C (cathepsin A)
MERSRSSFYFAACIAAALAASSVEAICQVPQALIAHQPSIAITKQTGTFGGQSVAYTAIVEEHILKGADSVPNAFLVTIAYVRDGVADNAKRPVAFVFNGGPGASSSPLHFSGIGPRVASQGTVVNNPHSILDAIDLVFIDPVGTGFSRPYTTDIGKRSYWNLDGDAASVKLTIDRWLKKYGREASPRYLIGESYGATRIGAILHNHKDAKFDGVVLISAVGGGSTREDIGYARSIPSMAVSAWYHEKIPRAGRTVDQVWNEAVAFTKGDYTAALARRDSLSAAEKSRIAAQLSSLTGLPQEFILEKNLRLLAQDWLMNILKDKGLRVSNQDTRVTGPLVLTAEQAAASSPAEGLGGTRIGTAMQAPALVPGSPEATAAETTQRTLSPLETYLRTDLQFKTPESYRSLNLDINVLWRLSGMANFDPAPGVAEGMRDNPRMRMFWIQGYYDLNTPAYGALASYEQAGLVGNRVTGMMAPGPHTAFATDETKQVLSAALRKWIAMRPE